MGLVSFDVYIVLVYLHADAMSTSTCMSVHKRLSPVMYQDAETSLDESPCVNITSMPQKSTNSLQSGEVQRLRRAIYEKVGSEDVSSLLLILKQNAFF